jgi:hypothetical protein
LKRGEEAMREKVVHENKVPAVEVANKEAILLVQGHILRGIIEEKYKLECLR